jgi:hypothetical protein
MFNLKRRWDLELSPKPCGDRHAPSPVAAIKRAQAKWAPPAGAPATGLADSKDPWVSPVDQSLEFDEPGRWGNQPGSLGHAMSATVA